MEQRTTEWFEARAGKITGSRFKDVMTKGRKKDEIFGQTALSYAYELATERLTGVPADSFSNAYMEWGTEQEPNARLIYELDSGNTVVETGFVEMNDYCGASPDGLVGEDGLVEIKCPKSTTHLNTLISKKVPSQYIPQIQGQLMVTGRKWCDFVSFDPRFQDPDQQIIIIRVKRDDKYIAELKERIDQLNDIICDIIKSAA